MTFKTIQRDLLSLKWWRSIAYIILGCFVLSAGFVLFINPYNIVPGGVYGLGIVMHYIFPNIQVGTFGFMFDLPLLCFGIKVFGRTFGVRTVVAAIFTPLFMNFMTFMIGNDPSIMLGGKIDFTGDIMLASIFGGLLIGTGIGTVIKHHGTTGGTDVVAMLANKFLKVPFSRGILVADSIIVLIGVVVLGDWKLPLYSLITIFVTAKVIDLIIDGASYDKLVFIVSDHHQQMQKFIMEEMERGATYIKSTGMYSGQSKEMIFLVVNRREVSTVQDRVREVDSDAFMVIVDAYETYGLGFKQFSSSPKL